MGHSHIDQEGGAEYATCNKCNQRWARRRAGGFQAYEGWLGHCARAKPEEGKAYPEEADASLNNVASRQFALEDVAARTGIQYKVGKQLTIMGESELRNDVGHVSKRMPSRTVFAQATSRKRASVDACHEVHCPESDSDYGEAMRDGAIIKSAPPPPLAPRVARVPIKR